MKYVKVPVPMLWNDPVSGKPFNEEGSEDNQDMSMFRLLKTFILVDNKWGKGWEALRSAGKIYDLFQYAAGGTVVAMEDADHKLLMDVMNSPSTPFQPRLLLHCLPFFEALANATSEPPKEEAKAAA